METRANYVLIGAFTLAVIAAGVGFVFWIAGVGRFNDRATYQVVFHGSVSGLVPGGLVLFNGVGVGEVQRVFFSPSNPGEVVAIAVIDRHAPIRSDTKARLETQGLTGSAAIALTGGAADAAPLKEEDGFAGTINADTSQLQSILQNVQDLTTKGDAVIDRVNKLLDANTGNINQVIANIADITKSLDQDNGAGISKALSGIAGLSNSLSPAVQELQKVVSHVDEVVAAVDPQQVKGIVDNASKFAKAVGDNSEGVGALMQSLSDLGKSLNPLIDQAKDLVGNLDKIAKSVDMAKIDDTVNNLQSFSGALVDAKPQLLSIASDVASLAKTLNGSSAQISSVIASLDASLKALDPQKITGIQDGIASFAQVLKDNSANVDAAVKKVGPMVDNLSSFSGALADAKPQFQSIVSDVQNLAKTINGSSDAITSILANLDGALKAFDPKKVASITDDLSSFAQTLKGNSGNVDTVMAQAADISKKLEVSVDKFNTLMSSLTDLSGSGEGKSALSEIGSAAASVRTLADQINQRVKDIAPGLTRFTSQGLREYEGLAVDGRRTINDVDRAVKNFENNPSQLIWGRKPGLPEYHGGP